ncbi:MAG: hypothetical protein ACLRNQ_02850 [Flavonifractor plautii]
MDISLRGELWDNDSADVLRFWGWRDITAPMDIAGALERAGGEDVTLAGQLARRRHGGGAGDPLHAPAVCLARPPRCSRASGPARPPWRPPAAR